MIHINELKENGKHDVYVISKELSHLVKRNKNRGILDSIIEYLYFDLQYHQFEKYINTEVDFSTFNFIMKHFNIHIEVDSDRFGYHFIINPPLDMVYQSRKLWNS